MPIAGEAIKKGDMCCFGRDGKLYKFHSVYPVENDSIPAGCVQVPAGFTPMPLGAIREESEGDMQRTMQDSIPPLNNNSIPAGFAPIESEGDVNPIGMVSANRQDVDKVFGKERQHSGNGVIRSKPFMQSNSSQDYEGQERCIDNEDES